MQLHCEYPLAFLNFIIVGVVAGCLLRNRYLHRESFSWRRFSLITIGLSLCVLGLTRPQLGRRDSQQLSVHSNVFFAFDVSQSMMAEDITPSRLAFGTAFVRKLLEQLSNVKVALFPFTVDGFIQTPLTNDVFVMSDMLASLSPSMTTSQGTDISNALELLFQNIAKMELATTSKGSDWFPTQVVLVSDGESHWPIKDSILHEYRVKSIPIFSVGVGTVAGAMIPLESHFGQGDYIRDKQGGTVKTELHPETLRKISDATGGDYFSSRFEEVYPLAKRITQSMKIAKLTTSFHVEKEYYPLLFLAALLLFAMEFGFGRWHFVIRSIVFIGLFLSTVSPIKCLAANEDDPARAYHAFNEGVDNLKQKNIPKAAELFEESALLSENKTLKKKALFNLGDALIRLSDPQNALQALQQAYDTKTNDSAFEKDTNKKISENMVLAAKLLQQMQKQAQQGEGEGSSEGQPQNPQKDPKGPRKFKGEMFSEEQKQRIYDLLSNDEQQTIQRLNEQRNKKTAQNQEKPW
jgi:tetratricopeptide (TPR) repeat protein/uncharacterized protein YegL